MNSSLLSSFIIQLLADGSNATSIYNDLASALYDLGYIFSIEILYMTIYLIISIVGIILNILTVLTTLQPTMYSRTSPPLFAYMRYGASVGIIGNLAGAIFGMNYCSDTLQFTNTYTSQWIQAYIAIPLINMGYYAKFLIEIAIVVDRILMLLPATRVRNLFKVKRPYLVMISIIIFTVFINYPYIYLFLTPQTTVLVKYDPLGHSDVYTFYTTGKNAWANWGSPGYWTMMSIYIFKHAVTFAVETILNITSLVLFKQHLENRARLIGINVTLIGQNVSTTATVNVQALAKNNEEDHASGESAGGRNMAYLVIFLSLTGFVHNVLLTGFQFYSLIYPKPSAQSRAFQFCAFLASAVRHAINFLQFYWFNNMFKKTARGLFVRMKCGCFGRGPVELPN
jgi:hypothetical protein